MLAKSCSLFIYYKRGPFVSFPEFAMERVPRPSWRLEAMSSANTYTYT